MAFMDDNFILSTGTAQQLYHGVAKDQPIVDYHCHLSPKDIADCLLYTSPSPRDS